MRSLIIALALAGCATQLPADPCPSRAEFAAQVVKDKGNGYPMPYAERHYLAQVAGDAEHSATVQAIIRGVYLRDATPEGIFKACKAGAP